MPVADQRILAIDIGGTKLAVGVVDAEGRVLETSRAPTPSVPGVLIADADSLFTAVLALVGQLRTDPGEFVGVGIGCGGPMRWPSGEVSPLNIPAWRGFPLR